MRITRRSVLAAIPALTAATAGCAFGGAKPTAGSDNRPVPSYRYGDHPSQYAELSVPPGTGMLPVVVVVHGGFWRTSYGAELGRPLAADLVDKGWAALNVEYRRVGSSPTAGGGGWPATGLDVAAAVDGLAEQGQRLAGGRLDLSRVVGLGHSAGGQLVGWLAGRPRLAGADPQVRLSGVVAQAGVLDLVGGARAFLGGGAVEAFMDGGPDRRATAYGQASPLARLPLRVPSVCVHGTADTTVPIGQSETFVAAARRLGDPAELQRFDGDHLDLIDTRTQAWQWCVEALAGMR